MPVWRAQCIFGADSDLPRHRMVITPHFNDGGFVSGAQGLASDLAAALESWAGSGTARMIQVKMYDAQGSQPVFPQADVVRNPTGFPLSGSPREIALCLSFFSERNLPRQRGRLYVPFTLISGGTPAVRPTLAHRQKLAELVPIFANLGATDVDWCVYSRADDEARPVSDWWIDDEWDVMRSRGLERTARLSGTVDE